MKREKFSKAKSALKGKGFVFTLALSVLAVGAATYIAYGSAVDQLKIDESTGGNDGGAVVVSDDQAVGKNQDDVPKPQTETAAETSAAAEEANNLFVAAPPRIMPVEGEIINPYSDGELVKSETLNVWQTHDGIDIAAEAGTEVKAMTAGTVSEIYEDPLWGICVVLDHGDGLFSYYFGVGEDVPVSVGQTVESGAVVAKVSNTADIEASLPSHLHFAVKKNGEFASPVEIVGE